MKILLTYLLLIFFSVAALADGQLRLTSQRISAQEGLPSNTVYELAQDPDGFIWMATNNGLSRYDGYTTLNYRSLSSAPGQRMEARVGRIACDQERQLLWMNTSTYVNACYDLRQARFVDWTGQGDQMRPLNKFYLSTRGMCFYGNDFGLRISDGRKATDYTQANGLLPSNRVVRVLEDATGNLWIATDRGMVCLPTEGQPKTWLEGHRVIACAVDSTSIYCMDEANRTYVCTMSGKTTAFLPSKRPEVVWSERPATIQAVKKVNISFVWKDRWMLFTPHGTVSVSTKDGSWRQETGETNIVNGLNQGELEGFHFVANDSGRLWVFGDNGRLKVLDLLSNSRFTSNKGRKFNIAADREGRLFIATYGNGLFVWHPQTDRLDHFKAEDDQPVVSTNYLLYAMSDRQGNIWIGSEEAGAYRVSVIGSGMVNQVLPEPSHKGDWANAVNAIAERKDSTIIIGTREGGLYELRMVNDEWRITRRMTLQSNIRTLLADRRDRLWIGTYDRGLYVDGTNYSMQDAVHNLPVNSVRALCQDARGRIWIGTWDGGLLMTVDKNQEVLTFKQFLANDMNRKRVNALTLDRQGMLWIGTNDGLYRLDTSRQDIEDQDFKGYYATGELPFSEINAIHVAADSTVWIAAVGSGLLKCRIGDGGQIVYSQITRREGLASNAVYSMVSDQTGYLWVGTDAGISRINTQNDIINSYQQQPFMQANVSTEGSALLTKDGHLLIGTLYGLQVISPMAKDSRAVAHSASSLGSSKNSSLFTPAITDLHVNGHSIYEDSTFCHSLSATTYIDLDAQENSLSFFFSNFAFAGIQSSLYQYYLEGMEKTWNPITTANHADYSELPPGHYTFHLRSLDANNEWLDEVQLTVIIHHPWYLRWWAVIIYVLLVALFGWYVYRNWKEKFDLHQQMKVDRQIADFRSRLFTSITHEFRTPLAIIKGAVDKLDGDKAAVQTAKRGTTRLLKLVNQFMEYRKATTGNLRLQVQQGDIVTFVRDIYQDFWQIAQQKNIHLTFEPNVKNQTMLFDRQMVESVVYNLLSNAVKYTPDGGSVKLTLRFDDSLDEPSAERAKFAISVKDSGPGIKPEQQAVLFQPFMQGKVSQGGMGIGLYTAQAMAEAHHGDLRYEAPSTFVFTLPLDETVYQPEDYATITALADDAHSDSTETETVIREMLPQALNDLTVAVIEDDPDMMTQIRQEVGTYFQTIAFTNGQAGYEGVTKQMPALVLCDVMLPDLDGYEIVKRLKDNAETRSIPVIMLTALADEAHQIKAYKAGADDYMVKPCNFRLLIARAMQLIKWSSKNTATISTAPSDSSAPITPDTSSSAFLTSQADKVFLDKLMLFTAQHLSEESFTIDLLAQMMNMGRTKFYGRVKELTGLSPNKFLMQERMKKAADLLADGELTVAEVSYKVGIQDPSYFNKCFKAQYGVTPSKYVRTS
ncbi:MAG: response regulator [Prevotella sp.]|nr:response regulator [Prevotella sp.]